MIDFIQVTRKRHTWSSQQHIPADPDAGEHERFIWSCQCCPLKRITVLPARGLAYRAYAWADGMEFEDEVEPECKPAAIGANAA